MAQKNNSNGRNNEKGRIVVINPNSTEAVTNGIDEALNPFRFSNGPRFDCVTIKNGPPGIATQRHVDDSALRVCEVIEREDSAADAFVIACFSEPGFYAAQEITTKPIFGIGTSSFAQATLLGERFGIIAILKESTVRQRRAVRIMGLEKRYAGSLPIGFGAEELKGDQVRDRMIEVGRTLIETHSADVLIMGCAGMARFQPDIATALGVPVIDPSQAAASQALAATCLSRK